MSTHSKSVVWNERNTNARQRISCICSCSSVNNGKERETTLLMRYLASKMTSHARVFSYNALKKYKLFSRYNESVNGSILSCFSLYLWINPRICVTCISVHVHWTGLVNTATAIQGFIGVYVAGYLLQTFHTWSYVFNSTAAISFIGALIFVTFASGEQVVWIYDYSVVCYPFLLPSVHVCFSRWLNCWLWSNISHCVALCTLYTVGMFYCRTIGTRQLLIRWFSTLNYFGIFVLWLILYGSHRHRSLVNFGGQDIFAWKYMYEKLTKCPNFTWYLPEYKLFII